MQTGMVFASSASQEIFGIFSFLVRYMKDPGCHVFSSPPAVALHISAGSLSLSPLFVVSVAALAHWVETQSWSPCSMFLCLVLATVLACCCPLVRLAPRVPYRCPTSFQVTLTLYPWATISRALSSLCSASAIIAMGLGVGTAGTTVTNQGLSHKHNDSHIKPRTMGRCNLFF